MISVRDGWRDAWEGSAALPPAHRCQVCGATYRSRRPSSYCSAACRQRAYRARRQQPLLSAAPARAHQLDVIYECGQCGERLVNQQRCDACNRFARRLGAAVTCPCCDEAILLPELLEQLG